MGRVNQRGVTRDPLEAGADARATETGTAVGVETRAQGRDTTALGLLAAAVAEDATALGAKSDAASQWNTVIGREAGSDNNGANVTIVGRQGAATGDNATVVGEMASAESDDATAVGRMATAEAAGSMALGFGTTATEPNAVAVGDRDREIESGRGLVYQSGSTAETLADLVVDPDLAQGEAVSYELQVGGISMLRVEAEADGNGGVQSPSVFIPQDLGVTGDLRQVDDVVTGEVQAQDGSGTAQFTADATTSPPTINFHGNDLDRVNRINAEGSTLEIDGDVDISGEISENQTL